MVRAVLTVLVAATPCWPARRPLLAPVRIAPPAKWAAMPARFSGVQRAQPLLATRSRWVGSSTTAAAPLTPVAPISEPPNQAARPRSCRVRATVLSVGAMRISPLRLFVTQQQRLAEYAAVRVSARWLLRGLPALCCAGQAPRSARPPRRAVLCAGQSA